MVHRQQKSSHKAAFLLYIETRVDNKSIHHYYIDRLCDRAINEDNQHRCYCKSGVHRLFYDS